MARIILCCLYSSLLLFLSCGEKSREDRIANYLESKGLANNDFSIGILNPDHCGSCTDYSVGWLCNRDATGKEKVILTTGSMNADYKQKLLKSGYQFIQIHADEIARVGIVLAACTYVETENGNVIKMETVK